MTLRLRGRWLNNVSHFAGNLYKTEQIRSCSGEFRPSKFGTRQKCFVFHHFMTRCCRGTRPSSKTRHSHGPLSLEICDCPRIWSKWVPIAEARTHLKCIVFQHFVTRCCPGTRPSSTIRHPRKATLLGNMWFWSMQVSSVPLGLYNIKRTGWGGRNSPLDIVLGARRPNGKGPGFRKNFMSRTVSIFHMFL